MACACFSSTTASPWAASRSTSLEGHLLPCYSIRRKVFLCDLLGGRQAESIATATRLPTSRWVVPRAHLEMDSLSDSLEDANINSSFLTSASAIDSDSRDTSAVAFESDRSIPPEGPKLYVGNLPWTCNNNDLEELFQDAGTVESAEVINDRETGRSRGFGFVTMGSMEDATAAISHFDGTEYMGRRLRVSFPDRSRNDGPRPHYDGPISNANKLYVGNLPWGLDDITLENLFSKHGRVVEAKVIFDRESGRSRGFGFVTMSSLEEANEAINKLDGAEVEGRPLRVNLSSDRPAPRQSFF